MGTKIILLSLENLRILYNDSIITDYFTDVKSYIFDSVQAINLMRIGPLRLRKMEFKRSIRVNFLGIEIDVGGILAEFTPVVHRLGLRGILLHCHVYSQRINKALKIEKNETKFSPYCNSGR